MTNTHLRRWHVWCIGASVASVAYGQAPSARADTEHAAIVGTVFDSLAQRPLGGAHVHIADLARDAIADSLGAFRFDDVTPGVHTVWADHPALDLLGLFSVSASVDVAPRAITVASLTVPSFATMWRHACGAAPAAVAGAGLVYGHVTGGREGEVFSARIQTSWRMVATDSGYEAGAEARRNVPVDPMGSFVVCGVPTQRLVTIAATSGSASTIPESFHVGAMRIARRDITIPTSGEVQQLAADSSVTAPLRRAAGATLTGIVHDSTGAPLRDARITVSGVAGEWRADAAGRFVIRGIPDGPHVVTSATLGFVPERRLLDASTSDSSAIDLTMTRLITTLSTVQIRELQGFARLGKWRRDEIDQRRRIGFGYWADSNDLARLPGVREAFNMPGVIVRSAPGGNWSLLMQGAHTITSKHGSGLALGCTPTYWVDGYEADIDFVQEVHKEEIAAIEVYHSAALAPLEFTDLKTNCGVVLIWRKLYVDP